MDVQRGGGFFLSPQKETAIYFNTIERKTFVLLLTIVMLHQ